MSEERQTPGRCGWTALGLVLVLLSGLFPGGFFGGLAGLRAAGLFGIDHAYDLGARLLILSGIVAGLLVATIVIMTGTVALVTLLRGQKEKATRQQPVLLKD